ncbi:hypothetical protein DM01DRAFT_1338725 [Hesseltinella vesiculosa]|uniref:GDP/GTP exchange factor Sec2 N-terminal domain-containing protein n=1 Tax=Hesseltinella vesiculosa TaxID=101127 RepID=A0A1X2G964_9FUNG|nr:hypothetical protein DM01DRAFT_1338725 [Hesseltinella vesiculosa]
MTDTLILSQPTPLTTPPPSTMRLPSLDTCQCESLQKQCALQASELSQLKVQLDERHQQLDRLAKDMQELNTKYVAAIDRVADIQHEKDLVEHDLEELSCKLFEEANDMVANEKKEKWILETQLQSVQQLLADEQDQLCELRQRLRQWEDLHQRRRPSHRPSSKKQKKNTPAARRHPSTFTLSSSSSSPDHLDHLDDSLDDLHSSPDHLSVQEEDSDDCWEDAIENIDDPQVRAQHDMALLHQATALPSTPTTDCIRAVSMPPPRSLQVYLRQCTVDQIQLDAFDTFVRSASSVPLKKLSQFPFIKYCQLEDVEPCLRFGPQSRLSVKKMMDFLLHQPCCIEQVSSPQQHQAYLQQSTAAVPAAVAQRNLWDRWHSTSHPSTNQPAQPSPTSQPPDEGSQRSSAASADDITIVCMACGLPRDYSKQSPYYQFRLHDADPWLPIDPYCRDRLVAVCEFFVYIRNIHLRLYTHRSIDDLYAENIRLRLQMFYSRLGTLPVILNKMGLDPASVGKASAPDQGYVSDVSQEAEPACPLPA